MLQNTIKQLFQEIEPDAKIHEFIGEGVSLLKDVKFFDGDWGKYASYVKNHNNIFKVWYSDNYHRCAYPGDYLVRFVDGNILVVNEGTFEDNFKEKN